LTADAQIKAHEASLSNAVASLDGERLEGAIKLGDAGGRMALSGTLAGAALDLGRLHGRLDLRPGGAAEAEPAPLDFEAWTAQDIDLRVSVDAARLGGARLEDVATYLLIKKDRFEAGLLRANAYGGAGKGRILAPTTPGGVDLKLQASFDKVNLGKAASDVPELARISGTGALQLVLDGLGGSFDDLVASLSGKIGLVLRQGEIGGIAFGDMLRRLERNPSLVQRDWRQGKTPFETATLNLNVMNGVALVTDGVLSAPGYRMTLAGQASLPTRWIEMGLLLTPTNGPLCLPFSFRGPIDNPALDLDTEALTRDATAFPTNLTR
jgi:AsmA protein